MNHNEEKQNNRSKWLILILLLITIISICITVWSLFFRGSDTVLVPDYAPEQIEQNQNPIKNDTSEKVEPFEGGGIVGIDYDNKVVIDLSDETISMYFANPNKSTKDMLVQVVVQGEVLAQSDRITAGNYITLLNMLEGSVEKLSVGQYNGIFQVFYYDIETGEKSVVNTEMPILITVIN